MLRQLYSNGMWKLPDEKKVMQTKACECFNRSLKQYYVHILH